jgi:hypothetical protein
MACRRCLGSVVLADNSRLPHTGCEIFAEFLRNSCVRSMAVAEVRSHFTALVIVDNGKAIGLDHTRHLASPDSELCCTPRIAVVRLQFGCWLCKLLRDDGEDERDGPIGRLAGREEWGG